MQLEGVDPGDRHPRAVDPLAGRRQEPLLDVGVVREQHPPAQGLQHDGQRIVDRGPGGDGVVGEPVDRGALTDLDPGLHDEAPGSGQVDRQPVDGHEADRQQPVLLGVQAGGLQVDRQQAQVPDGGAGSGKGVCR
jgi:hypothetical protein